MLKIEPYTRTLHDAIVTLRHALRSELPESRERAIAMTKLDEAQLWAHAAMNTASEPTDLGLGMPRTEDEG